MFSPDQLPVQVCFAVFLLSQWGGGLGARHLIPPLPLIEFAATTSIIPHLYMVVYFCRNALVTELEDEKSTLHKTVKGIKNGVSIAQDIAKGYNDVGQWLGLPQVPKPFLKK